MDMYCKQAEYWNRWSDQIHKIGYSMIMEELLSKLHYWKIPLLAHLYEVKECLCNTPGSPLRERAVARVRDQNVQFLRLVPTRDTAILGIHLHLGKTNRNH